MDWRDALKKLHELHEMRKTMSFASVYHGTYEKMAIDLNRIIQDQTGKNYVDFLIITNEGAIILDEKEVKIEWGIEGE